MVTRRGGCGSGCYGRKTYKKKSSAKRARKRGQSIYKVKGGYRLGKKKRK